MNTKVFADKLTGRQIGDEITPKEIAEAKEYGFVIVFGASDDLMEFRGAIEDEASCYNGGEVFLNEKGLINRECEDDQCPHEARRIRQAKNAIIANWDDGSGFSWTYEASMPHQTFEIFDENEKYCRGFVFAMADLS